MPVLNYPTKIFGSAIVFCVAVAVLFAYGLPWLAHKHEAQLAAILDQKKTVLELRQEQKNVELAKKDLEDLAKKEKLPDDFFSKDTTLVGDLAILESRARDLEVDFALSVSGTLNTAAKAKTSSDLYVVPFSVQLAGDFQSVVSYLDFLEHTATIFTVRSVNMSANAKGQVNSGLVGNFYLKK
jgi:hypothetical protein